MTTATEADARIRAALEAGPQAWSYDSNDTPFYNDAEGHSRGGDPDGTYCLFGEPFEIDGELYDGPVLSECCGKADAMFISACSPEALRALLTERAELLAKVRELEDAIVSEMDAGWACNSHHPKLSRAYAAIAAQQEKLG